MKTPPPIDHSSIRNVLASRWDLPNVSLSYLPLGFGSHHWSAAAIGDERQRWFVSIDADRPAWASPERLERAMATAYALRHRAKLEFVVAPIPDRDGKVVAALEGGRWTISVFPFVRVSASDSGFGSGRDRAEALRLVARLHQATDHVPPGLAPHLDLAIAGRATLFAALDRLGTRWSGGPYAEPARSLLAAHQRAVQRAFLHYDALTETVNTDPSPWVITHGEPHAGNAVKRRDGQGLLLVDWDTVALAPRERDLWQLLGEGADSTLDLDAYWSTCGEEADLSVSEAALALFQLAWDLDEVAVYVGWYTRPHEDSADMQAGWKDLVVSMTALARQFPAR